MRCTSYKSYFYFRVNMASSFTRSPLFPASLLSSVPPSLHCGGRCGCLNPNFTASSWVSASEARQRCLCQLFSTTWSWQGRTAAGREETEQRKGTDKERIAASRFDKGKKGGMECDRNVDTERRRWQAMKDKMWCRESRKGTHLTSILLEYIKTFGR